MWHALTALHLLGPAYQSSRKVLPGPPTEQFIFMVDAFRRCSVFKSCVFVYL